MFDVPLERNLIHPIPAHIADGVKLVVLRDLPSGVKCRGMVRHIRAPVYQITLAVVLNVLKHSRCKCAPGTRLPRSAQWCTYQW